MTVPTHFKFVARGVFNATPEEWSYSLKYARNVPAGPDAGLEDINGTAVDTAFGNFHANARFAANCWMTGWRAYVIGTDGNMQGNPLLHDWGPTAYKKGTSSTYNELSTAMCVTTVAEDRGPANLGRFFLPPPALAVTSDGRWAQSSIATWVTDVTTLLKAVSQAIDLDLSLANAPLINVSAVGSGKTQDVKRIRVGRVPDHQQRRRRSLDEDYQENPTDIDW